ncbi:hypothetical protein CLOM_g6447 [Closterium sp. NIES-68]|nr:hypothetical protein CLOM_g6447 [Closterium sp. NIES-68]
MRAATPLRLEGRAVVAGAEQRAPNGPSGRGGPRRGRRGSALERRLARTAATLEGILERAGAGLLPSPPQQDPPRRLPLQAQPLLPPQVLPPPLPDQPAPVGACPPRLQHVQPRPVVARGDEQTSLHFPPPPLAAPLLSAPAPMLQPLPPGGPYPALRPAAHLPPPYVSVLSPPGYYDPHRGSLPAPQMGGPVTSADTLPEWHPPSSWAGSAEWAEPQVGLYRGGGVVGGLSMAPYFPLQGCMEAAIDLAVEAARARPGPSRGTGTDPLLLAALRQVSASIDSASAAGLVAGAVSTLQVLMSYQAALLEEAGLAAVAE